MDLKVQKRIAAQVLGCSPKRVIFDNEALDDIKAAITKRDIRLLIGAGAISSKPVKGVSRVRARKIKVQKSKGRQKGPGSRKGKYDTHFKSKLFWMNNIRFQRAFLKEISEKDIIDRKTYRDLYLKAKGGFFRSKRHIKIYIEEHGLAKKPESRKAGATHKNIDASNARKEGNPKRERILKTRNDKRSGEKDARASEDADISESLQE
jgi:large subunit ribosomal protein L19e